MREDTLLGGVHGRTRRFAKGFGPLLVFWIFLMVSFVSIIAPTDQDRAARRACDQAVEVLLTSRDPIGLQRSGILIHELNCGISRRLPKVP